MHRDPVIKQVVPVALCVTLLLAGCGGGEMSHPEYVERVEAIQNRGIEQYEDLVTSPQGELLVVGQGPHLGFADQGAELTGFTPQDLHVALERVAEIQAEALEDAAAIEPPEQIAGLHSPHFRELPIEALVARAGTAANWEELSESPEMAAYRAALAADR